ncbi:MAG: tyrosine-type recombinase/integrase [Proteobacteria bacterium]|nr:tyrosine-type recombinase/integrase [Pseudomonadota bacterium]
MLPEDSVRERFITEEELDKILQFLDSEIVPVFMIACHTGMRLGEILGLRWKNVDLERRLFLFEGEKSGKKRRAVALHPEITNLFKSMPRSFGETRYSI